MLPSVSLSLSQFLQDTMDTLFAVLDESPQRYGLKVFDCLVRHVYNYAISDLQFSAECFANCILMTHLFPFFSPAVLPWLPTEYKWQQNVFNCVGQWQGLHYNCLKFEKFTLCY